MAAPKIVGAATIDKNTGIAECLGNCGVSIFKVSNGIVAQNDKLAMTINGSQPSIPVYDSITGQSAKQPTKTKL